MNNNVQPEFIIIDDDSINNTICELYINIAVPGASVITFTDPEEGLKYIQAKYAAKAPGQAILLLDINMPTLTGWDVLHRFKDFPEMVKQQCKIYMLSSSIAVEDKEKADDSPLVSGFIEKPLSVEQLKAICG